MGDLTAAPWEYGYANLGHRLTYARRSVPPPGVGIGSSLSLLDKEALAVRDYARALPYEDADPRTISAQARMPETEQQQELGEQQPIFADESSAAASGSQPMQDVGHSLKSRNLTSRGLTSTGVTPRVLHSGVLHPGVLHSGSYIQRSYV